MARRTGTIAYFKDDKGYGFIRPDGGGGNIYVNRASLRLGINQSLQAGDRVEYEVGEGSQDFQAINVMKISKPGSD